MELDSHISSERYNPITGVSIPVQPPRANSSAIFGGSPGGIEYMFIPPSATTRPTIPNTAEKRRRSLSKENIRRSSTTATDSLRDSDGCSSISDLSECSSEIEHRQRTRTNSGTYSRTRQSIKRSESSRLPVSVTRPQVMKRAHSFTRGTESGIPRGHNNVTRASTNEQMNSSTELSDDIQRSGVEGTSKIPRKINARVGGVQTSRIPQQQKSRADMLNSSLPNREKTGKENKKTEVGPAENNSKQNTVSGIRVKGTVTTQQHSGIPRTAIGGQREDRLKKSTSRPQGTGNELESRTNNDVSQSKLPRKSSIPRSKSGKISQKNTSMMKPVEAIDVKSSQTKMQSVRSARSSDTSNTLQRSDSGYGDTDSVESGNEHNLSRENSRSKIPILPRKSRGGAKTSREITTVNDNTTMIDNTNERVMNEEWSNSIAMGLKASSGDNEGHSMIECQESRLSMSNSEEVIKDNKSPDSSKVNNNIEIKTDRVVKMENLTSCSANLDNLDIVEEKDSKLEEREQRVLVNKRQMNKDSQSICVQLKEEKELTKEEEISEHYHINNDEDQQNTRSKSNETFPMKDVLQTTNGFEAGLQEKKTGAKQSPKKPPRLSKIMTQNCEENGDNNSTIATTQNMNRDGLNNKNIDEGERSEVNLKHSTVMEDEIKRKISRVDPIPTQKKLHEKYRVTSEESEMMNNIKEVETDVDVLKKVGSTQQQQLDVGVGEETQGPPRRYDNCLECRMEQSMIDGEDLEVVRHDPGFRQYPTFISPRKSLVTCKHHAQQSNDMNIAREQSTSSKTATETADIQSRDNNVVEVESQNEEHNISTSTQNILKGSFKKSENIKSDKFSMESVVNSNVKCSKGHHSPLLALSRDKKFVSMGKAPVQEIKTSLSLEWDDTGTELSPPNFSDDDVDNNGKLGDLEEDRTPGVKLMNTNEALDKLKVIQSLIMKEAESRDRKRSEENGKKCAVNHRETGDESRKYSIGAKQDVTTKYDSDSEIIFTKVERTGGKATSPTIWDRITDNMTISQDQTTELLNETLAKLKASPKLSGNVFAKRTLSSRSLPGSRQASKEQLLSDGDRPVYVYTSNWMNTSERNSRDSLLSLCSNNRSLPSSTHNLNNYKPETGLKRSESAAGRMDNGKGLETRDVRLSNFDEINLSDDLNELKSEKTAHRRKSSVEDEKSDKNDEKARKNSTKREKIRRKNTATLMNTNTVIGLSLDDVTQDKTTCSCGRNKCIIS